MKYSVIVLMALCVAVHAYDRFKLAQRPGSQPNFMLDKWLGKWYLQARLASCSWSGSNEFTDWTQVLSQDQRSVISTETWRNDACSTTSARLTQNQHQYGCFKVKDTFGDVWSGDQVVPATDYKKFAISWGCTKLEVDGKTCSDTWVTVKTRRANPDQYTWKAIEAILRKLWDLSLTEMRRIPHNNAC